MLELEHGFHVVDAHTRLDPDAGSAGARGRITAPEDVEREMRQAGIVRTVVFPGYREGGYLRANNAVARHAVDRPFVAFARINGPRDPAGSPVARLRNLVAAPDDRHVTPEDVARYGYDDRFHGFKLVPARDGLPGEDVIGELEDVGLPVIVRVGPGFPPEALAATLLRRSFPVVVAHPGGYPMDREHVHGTIDLLSAHDECYVETGVVRFREVLERAMREHPDRVLFGSGAPDVHPNVGVMEVLTLDVPRDAMRKAFSRNPTRVIPALDGRAFVG